MHARTAITLLVTTIVASTSAALAIYPTHAAGPIDETDEMPSLLASPEQPWAAGKVLATHRDSHTIAIEHRPIESFYMPNMTMVFRVADPSLLVGLTAGDKIRFKVERDGRSYTITAIENSN
jgi:Cu(I)/Ag(I) efflux system protein CusF